jgi:site-specific DNA recombinase
MISLYDDYLYRRISEDELGLQTGLTRQLRECRDVSAADGGRVVGEFSDNDISASKMAPRPGYEALMAALAAPNPDGRQRRIVTVHTSRLWRNRVERAIGIDTWGKANIIIRPKNGPLLDLRSASGRMVAGMIGETDTGESETKAERIVSAAVERAQEGRANGAVLYGWTRKYIYDDRGKVIGFGDHENPAEADIVREIVNRLLGNESVISITKDLNRRGVRSPGAGQRRKARGPGQPADGAKWGKSSVRKVATRHANVGLRIFHRNRPDEALIPAAWPRIVDPDKHDRVVALLSDPKRNTEKPGSRQHLLTWGIGECGRCGGYLRSALRGNARYGSKQLLYVCAEEDCVGRNETAVDRLVKHHMVALLQRPDVVDLLTGSSTQAAEALAQLETLRARQSKAADEYAEGEITSDQLRIINAKMRPKIEAAEAAVAAHRPSPHLELVMASVGDVAERRWEGMDVNQRRAVMQAFGVRVVIQPVTRRGPGFDPESVQVVPRQRDGR